MISSDITGALATLRIQDMRRSATAWRGVTAAKDARHPAARRVRDVVRSLRSRGPRWAGRGQLGPVHNYVTH